MKGRKNGHWCCFTGSENVSHRWYDTTATVHISDSLRGVIFEPDKTYDENISIMCWFVVVNMLVFVIFWNSLKFDICTALQQPSRDGTLHWIEANDIVCTRVFIWVLETSFLNTLIYCLSTTSQHVRSIIDVTAVMLYSLHSVWSLFFGKKA